MATSKTPTGPGRSPGPATTGPASSPAPETTGPGGRRPRRADAERSIAAILDAALICFSRSPDATMTEIAAEAGVGRVTLYAHFPSREAVLDALMRRYLAQATMMLDAIESDASTATDAVTRFLHSPWLTDRHQGVLAAAARHLGEEQVRQLHGPILDRIEQLIARGQAEGAFRADLPRSWLVTSVYALAHAAIGEYDRGELTAATAADLVTESVLSLFQPPAAPGSGR